jgi:hypothetical protein
MQRSEESNGWRRRLIFHLLFMLASAVLAIAYFSRGDMGMGWVWLILAVGNAALSLLNWSRLRRRHPAP